MTQSQSAFALHRNSAFEIHTTTVMANLDTINNNLIRYFVLELQKRSFVVIARKCFIQTLCNMMEMNVNEQNKRI